MQRLIEAARGRSTRRGVIKILHGKPDGIRPDPAHDRSVPPFKRYYINRSNELLLCGSTTQTTPAELFFSFFNSSKKIYKKSYWQL